MADAASPYAPGTIGDEPGPPRPAGSAALFVIATFAMVVIGPGYLGIPWSRLVTGAQFADDRTLLFYVLCCAPTVLVVVWALVSDAWPIMDTRREGHLLLAALLAAIAWLALPFVLDNRIAWTLTWSANTVANAIAAAAVGGAMVEIGRRQGATGRLAAAWIGAIILAGLTADPARTVLAAMQPGWAAGVCVGLAMAVVLLIGVLPKPTGEPARVVAAPAALRTYLRARVLWASAAVQACGAFASIPDEVIRAADWSATAHAANLVAQLVSCGVYFFLCRRIAFADLLRRALLLNCVVVIALIRVWNPAGGGGQTVALIGQGLMEAFVEVALTDLLIRTAPEGREAFGCALLTAVYLAAWAGWKLLASSLGLSLSAATTVVALASVVSTLAVGLLPASLLVRREGERG